MSEFFGSVSRGRVSAAITPDEARVIALSPASPSVVAPKGCREIAVKLTRVLMMLVGLVVASASLTALGFGMRAVMGVGGFCAEGGAYEIETHCPQGTLGIMTLSIPLGLGGLALYSMANRPLPGPDLTLLAWPALFVSLGYNFLERALRSFGGEDSGGAIGWVVCGIMFVIMGVVPLLALRTRATRRSIFWAHPPSEGATSHRKESLLA